MTHRKSPVRVLHVVGRLHIGGIEKWLLEVARRSDRSSVVMDFVVQSKAPGAYDDEIRSLGSKIHIAPRASRPWDYPRYLAQLISILSQGSYDVVHAHMGPNSAVILALAKMFRVPIRIAHSHNDKYNPQEAPFPRNLYLNMSRNILPRVATHRIGVSQRAARSLFGSDWEERTTTGILSCGIDLSSLRTSSQDHSILPTLGIERGAPVIGTAGRITAIKNPGLLAEIFATVLEHVPNAWFLVIGDGPERSQLESIATILGVRNRLIITGFQDNVTQLMRDTLDVFILPSRAEGLSLVTIEAQAAGVPVVVSSAVPSEANVVPELFTQMPYEASIQDWVAAILHTLTLPKMTDVALQSVLASQFNIEYSWKALEQLYTTGALPEHPDYPKFETGNRIEA